MIKGQVPFEKYNAGNTELKWDIDNLKSSHKNIAEHKYNTGKIDKGYANKTLYINLTSGRAVYL